jgi:AcrR family transcriptional regulator
VAGVVMFELSKMTNEAHFFSKTSGTREEILESTFHALCEHGYAELTISKIGDHFDKSQSLIYNHYENKDDLLLDLLEYILEELESQVPLSTQSQRDYMSEIIDEIFGDTDGSNAQFSKAVLELRAQTAHNDEYRELFNRSDEFVRKQIALVIREGNEQGVFNVEQPKQAAALFQTVIVGIQGQQTTDDMNMIGSTKSEFQRYVDQCLLSSTEREK